MTQDTAWRPETFLRLEDYREVEEVLRRGRDFVLHGTKEESDEFVHGTMVAIDGPDHMARRRQLLRMIGPRQPWGPEGTLLDQLFTEAVERLRLAEPSEDPWRAFDLVSFSREVLWQFTARMVGLDGVDEPARVKQFVHLAEPVLRALAVEYLPKDERPAVIDAARSASETIRSEMFLPSVERRRMLLAEVTATGGSPDELPADLITSLLAAGAVQENDLEPIFREMLELLAGSINNPVSQVAWGVHELSSWLTDHPEDRSKLGRRDFLNLVVKETLRLHRSSRPYLIRIAAQDVVLESTGRAIPAGTWVASWVGAANQDESVFGANADSFDPYRTIQDPKTPHFGVAFGSGPHVCLGRPMLLWEQGGEHAQGIQTKFLRWLFERDVRPNPQGEHLIAGEPGGRRYERYDVLMRVHPDPATR